MTLGLTWSPFPLDLDSSWWYQNAMRQNKPREGATRETYDGKMLKQWIPLVAYMPTTNYTLLPLSLSLSGCPSSSFPSLSLALNSPFRVIYRDPCLECREPAPRIRTLILNLQTQRKEDAVRSHHPPKNKPPAAGVGVGLCPGLFSIDSSPTPVFVFIALNGSDLCLAARGRIPSRSHCEMLGDEGGR